MDVVVLVSGRGSNLKAICNAIDAGACQVDIAGVVSDRSKARALELAEARGIPTRVVPLRKGDDRDRWNEMLAAEVAELEPELIDRGSQPCDLGLLGHRNSPRAARIPVRRTGFGRG